MWLGRGLSFSSTIEDRNRALQDLKKKKKKKIDIFLKIWRKTSQILYGKAELFHNFCGYPNITKCLLCNQ
jgi:hypothetical protein